MAFLAAVKSAKGTIGSGDRTGSQAEGLRSAVLGLVGASADDFAARNIVFGSQTKPGAEVFDGGPFGHIRTDLREDRLSDGNADTIDRSQVNTGNADQRFNPNPETSERRMSCGDVLNVVVLNWINIECPMVQCGAMIAFFG